MAKSSSVNKVARAAAAGSPKTSRPGDRPLFFPIAMAIVVVIGVVFIILARNERVDSADNEDPRIGDHWHSAYEVNVCGTVQSVLPDDSIDDRTGIHSHGDGLIHIHPFVTTVTGRGATLGAFFDEGGWELSDTRLRTHSVDITEGETQCDGVDGQLVVLKWVSTGADDPLIFEEGLADVRLDQPDASRGQLFTIAYVPVGEDIDFAAMKPDTTFLENYVLLDDQPLNEGDTGDTGTQDDPDVTPTTVDEETTPTSEG